MTAWGDDHIWQGGRQAGRTLNIGHRELWDLGLMTFDLRSLQNKS